MLSKLRKLLLSPISVLVIVAMGLYHTLFVVRAPETVNSLCPMTGEFANEEIWAEFGEVKVAFCCPKCRDEWNKLTSAEQSLILAVTLENEK